MRSSLTADDMSGEYESRRKDAISSDGNSSNTICHNRDSCYTTRYIPPGPLSLEEDSPGWGKQQGGPICWKCRGYMFRMRSCTVCQGKGWIRSTRLGRVDQGQDISQVSPGRITRARKTFSSATSNHAVATAWDPTPYALLPLQDCFPDSSAPWMQWMIQADEDCRDVKIDDDDKELGQSNSPMPVWIPQPGEELCRLVGRWRILQCVRSHRWTTDDLMTAWVAVRELQVLTGEMLKSQATRQRQHRYLDLGTGNASVLQMVLWGAQKFSIDVVHTVGIEAREEAVNLARRSLAFNLPPDASVNVIRGDFRELNDTNHEHWRKDDSFTLITGTPPYFRVNFHINRDDTVQKAVIGQGGMPTAIQSAPARCEFRGGIEAYCHVAARMLRRDCGRFVVCENWNNHARVVAAAESTGLHILRMIQVEGRLGRGILFSVYVMMSNRSPAKDDAATPSPATEVVTLAVRDEQGNWTHEYMMTVMKDMGIPLLFDQSQ